MAVAWDSTHCKDRRRSCRLHLTQCLGILRLLRGRYPDKIIPETVWWIQRLQDSNFFCRLRKLGPLQDFRGRLHRLGAWGIGITFGDKWAAFHLADDRKIEGRNIYWLETVAIEILVYFLEAMGFENIRLLIHLDNQGTIGAMRKSRSPNYIHRIRGDIGPLYIQPVHRVRQESC